MVTQQDKPKHNTTNNRRLRVVLILAAIVLAGLVLRVLYLREIVKSPTFSYPQVDAGYHDYWARGLSTGNWEITKGFTKVGDPEIQTSPYFRPPGYPYFLAAVHLLSGGSYLAARIVQMGLGLVNCLLAYFLGRKIFGVIPALISAAFMATYWGFIYFEGELLAPVLLITLGLSLIHVLLIWYDKFTFWRGILGGVVLGLFALARANILLFAPVVLCWSWWMGHKRKQGKQIAVMWLGFVIGAAVTITPATIRNYKVADDFVLITSNAGVNLYIGNNENSTGGYSTIPDVEKLGVDEMWGSFDYPKILRGVEALEGKKMKYSQLSSFFTKKANDYIKGHPGRFLKLVAIKTAYFWGPAEIPNNKEIHFEKINSATLRYLPGFAMVLSTAVIGLIQLLLAKRKTNATVTTKQFEMSMLVVLLIVTYFVSHLPFFVAGRFRVPVIPFLFLFGGYGLYRIGRLAVCRNFYKAACWVVVLVALYILASMQLAPYKPNLSRWHYGRGVSFSSAGQFDSAITEYREVIKLKPEFTKAHYNLGYALGKQNRFSEAAGSYRQVIKLAPNNAEAYYNLGYVLQSQNEPNEAISSYRQAIQLAPNYAKAYNNLGFVLRSQGKFDEAITSFRNAIRINADFVSSHYNLGLALVAKGQIDGAIESFRETVRLAPRLWEPLNALAWLLATHQDKGDALEAIAFAERATELTNRQNVYVLDTLAAAYASSGQFDKAVEIAATAIELAQKASADKLASDIENRLKLYRQLKPYRETVRQ